MLNFLKPNLWKIVLTLALLIISSILWRTFVVSRISDTFPMGFPFQFYMAWGPCQAGEDCSEFNSIYLVLDLLIWYVSSALLVDRLRRSRA